MANALVTGASRGFGLAVARTLSDRRWRLLIDARGESALARAAEELGRYGDATAIAGDVADPAHRSRLADVVRTWGSLDVLINNASALGPSPQPELASYPLDVLESVFRVNTFAPLMLIQE
nr:SDR family NAD(P)-dependent oxidoreductase [Actinomycetota bacterium]